MKNHAYHAELFLCVKFEMEKEEEIVHTFSIFLGKKIAKFNTSKDSKIFCPYLDFSGFLVGGHSFRPTIDAKHGKKHWSYGGEGEAPPDRLPRITLQLGVTCFMNNNRSGAHQLLLKEKIQNTLVPWPFQHMSIQ